MMRSLKYVSLIYHTGKCERNTQCVQVSFHAVAVDAWYQYENEEIIPFAYSRSICDACCLDGIVSPPPFLTPNTSAHLVTRGKPMSKLTRWPITLVSWPPNSGPYFFGANDPTFRSALVPARNLVSSPSRDSFLFHFFC